tara:strand:- start:486 stop:1205 length:720 start_codon:yes stop_codon:yes gene_type:complete
MIRLLTATLLVTSFSVVADTKVPNIFIDGTPAKASEVNENFDALEAAIEAIPADAIKAVTSADLDMDGNRVLFSNVYSQLADLPSATDNHGMFAHVHETGEAYYAHAGNWIQLAKQSSRGYASPTGPAGPPGADGVVNGVACTTDQVIVYRGGAWVCSSPERKATVGSFSSETATATCSNGKKVTGGGCRFDMEPEPDSSCKNSSYPAPDLGSWRCESMVVGSGSEYMCQIIEAYAICQ